MLNSWGGFHIIEIVKCQRKIVTGVQRVEGSGVCLAPSIKPHQQNLIKDRTHMDSLSVFHLALRYGQLMTSSMLETL